MSRWFRSAPKAQGPSMTAEEEDRNLASAEQGLLKLLDDDIEEADRLLNQGDSTYHYLGRGISRFLAAVLGGEKELLRDAAATLGAAEAKAWEDMKKAQKEPAAFRSEIYPPGTEYLLAYAIAQLTGALAAVLSGSVTEAIKGFYKLRKAYLTLNGIVEDEAKYLRRMKPSPNRALHSRNNSSRLSNERGPEHDTNFNENANRLSVEAPRNKDGHRRSQSGSISSTRLGSLEVPSTLASRTTSNVLDEDPATLGFTHHTDIYIHSGSRLCYGILLVVFSMIENPVFTKILYIVGFKGDRERGARYLWEAARFDNFCSAIAGIALLGYYNSLIGMCDILPTDAMAEDDLSGYPKKRCEGLLTDMLKRFPNSRLWKLEQARMLGYKKELSEGVKILTDNSNSKLKEIKVITMFELSMSAMFSHQYELASESWSTIADLSKWSPTLYAYMAGANYLELYRNLIDSDPAAAKVYKDKATEAIRKGPPAAGKQKVMNKELPFDVFVVRKVKKWEERAKEWGVDLVDAIGVAPLAEMTYLWSGLKKQSAEELEKSLAMIQLERSSQSEKHKLDLDEVAVQAVVKAAILRNMKRFDEAREVITTEILGHEKHEFKGLLKDDWSHPYAHYELAALDWVEKDVEGVDHKAKVLECEKWLDQTKNWGEPYVMDTRMSFRMTTSLMTVKRHKRIMGF